MSVQDGLFLIRMRQRRYRPYYLSPGMGVTRDKEYAHRYTLSDALMVIQGRKKLLSPVPVKE